MSTTTIATPATTSAPPPAEIPWEELDEPARQARNKARMAAWRKASGVKEPQFGHFPGWLRSRVGSDVNMAVQSISINYDGINIFDHHGRIRDTDGEWLLVTEPYRKVDDPKMIATVRAVAEAIFCDYTISPDSWWYPGGTIRITWKPRADISQAEAVQILREREMEERRKRRKGVR